MGLDEIFGVFIPPSMNPRSALTEFHDSRTELIMELICKNPYTDSLGLRQSYEHKNSGNFHRQISSPASIHQIF